MKRYKVRLTHSKRATMYIMADSGKDAREQALRRAEAGKVRWHDYGVYSNQVKEAPRKSKGTA